MGCAKGLFQPLREKPKGSLKWPHRYKGDKRVAHRIKAVLLKNEGWKNKAIAQALHVHEETERYYVIDWIFDEKWKPENGGSYRKLDDTPSRELEGHLEKTTYIRPMDIWAYIEKTDGRHDTIRCNEMAAPAKADATAQEEGIEKYIQWITDTSENEPTLFMDSAHPKMATKVVCGWIRKDVDQLLPKQLQERV